MRRSSGRRAGLAKATTVVTHRVSSHDPHARPTLVEPLEGRVLLTGAVDYGDAPASYGTLAANGGAGHEVVQGFYLGSSVDTEADGLPSIGAAGDDQSGSAPDDEDGVTLSPLVAGDSATATFVVHLPVGMATATVTAYVDYNGDGSFTDESPVFGRSVTDGTNVIPFNVRPGAAPGQTYARFRLSPSFGVGPTGLAFGGEVEDYLVTILPGTDWGDAPAPYATLAANNGASHFRVAGLYLGSRVDGELDGQPSAIADGDDLNGDAGGADDDEDGVTFGTLIAGERSSASVVVHLPQDLPSASLTAYFDWNGNGSFFDDIGSLLGVPVVAGANTVTINVPSNATPGQTIARFRLTLSTTPGPTGPAFGGEVEDHLITINPGTDWGDAPISYGTLANGNGASHTRVSGLYLGTDIDGELNGQPSVNALGDDAAGLFPDDEDGVTLPAAGIVAGEQATAQVIVHLPAGTSSASLTAYVDWNASGTFLDDAPALNGVPVTAGTNSLTINVPGNAIPGQTFARFRLAQGGFSSATGMVLGGEVEDYLVTIQPSTDWGDAPVSYGTLASNNGASHTRISGLYLGNAVDGEPDGQPAPGATGDDAAGATPDDEDGVTVPTTLTSGEPATVQVVVHLPAGSTTAALTAYFDWNGNGSFGDEAAALQGVTVSAGVNNLTVNVPGSAAAGQTYARFRLAPGGITPPTGNVPGGEVEDHLVTISPGTDFGDAPAVYGTLSASNGAAHTRLSGFYLGAGVDGELNGQPTVDAAGDDAAGSGGTDDEDGVTIPTLVPGAPATVKVNVHLPPGTSSARLTGFIDWNGNGNFLDDPIVAPGVVVAAGNNDITFDVPANATTGQTYARFRLATAFANPTGVVAGGEVEDYLVSVSQVAWLAPDSQATWDPASHTLNVTGAATIVADPGTNDAIVNVSGSGAVLRIAPPAGGVVRINSFNVTNGGGVMVAARARTGGNLTNVVLGSVGPAAVGGAFNVDGTSRFDLGDGVMIFRSAPVANVQAAVATGRNGGAWNGAGGISSSAAATDPTHSTAIGFASNASLNKTSFAGFSELGAADVLVKYTYAGDANLDGQIDIGDLGLVSGAWQQPTGQTWFDGDFTDDGAVDIGDLGLLAGNWQKGVGNPL